MPRPLRWALRGRSCAVLCGRSCAALRGLDAENGADGRSWVGVVVVVVLDGLRAAGLGWVRATLAVELVLARCPAAFATVPPKACCDGTGHAGAQKQAQTRLSQRQATQAMEPALAVVALALTHDRAKREQAKHCPPSGGLSLRGWAPKPACSALARQLVPANSV
jgi:hypothetical protein